MYNVKFREIIIRLEITTYLCEEKYTNGMQSLLVILIVITGIILPTQVKGEREDYILLISSYNSNSSWAKTLEASFRQELKKNDCPYPVYSEYLNTDCLLHRKSGFKVPVSF